MFRKLILLILLLPLVFFGSLQVNAAPPSPLNKGGQPPCWPPPCTVPIDGGLSFLIAAGIGLAGKKLYDSSKK